MKICLPPLFALMFIASIPSLQAQTLPWPGIKDSLYSETLKEQRKLQVILPADYKPGSDQKFEVVYMLDGEWYMEQIPFIYNFVANSGYAPKVIFVLIPNTYVNNVNLRDRDFSPTRNNGPEHLGHADNFHAFLKNELIPYIEKKYPAGKDKTLVGSSFSGLFSVYAFVKEPGLFNAYIASDPNLNWDNNYVSKLAAQKFDSLPDLSSTLFIAGLETSFHDMGSEQMDSVLKAKAPAGLHWKCIPYANETHYSVQHKAFYDGFRFVHFGFSKRQPEFHPASGTVEKDKPFKGYFITDNPALRYTTDGSEPDLTSPAVKAGEVTLTGPVRIKVKSFAHRSAYDQAFQVSLPAGEAVQPVKSKKVLKPGLNFYHYLGDWNQLPDLKKIKAKETQAIAKGFNINKFSGEGNSVYVAEGVLEVPEDAYCVFVIESIDGSKLYFNDQLVLPADNVKGNGQRSFGIPVKKGLFPIRLELLRKKASGNVQFVIFSTQAGNDRWWQKVVVNLAADDEG